MFRIESYITSIILSNADRYIKNFRKEDAQVSLWEGDATFHNIELNVDALNEEFHSVFIFTSGYIRDLTIHVPWTKLVSEPVTISVNTIECVMKLKSKEDTCLLNKKRTESKFDAEHKRDNENEMVEENTPSSSYSTALTAKIMNNLSIRCKNIILKLVDEDIVLSMNIEKLNFDNVNEGWMQSITDFNVEKLLTRKTVTLSGVTICLDEQNSSGRIDTYLEPLLYRSLISIRILRCYNRAVSRKPIYTHIDIFSDKMSFTICEPQLPMLIKLAILFFNACGQKNPDLETSSLRSENEPHSDEPDTINAKTFDEIKEETSWSNWLWNMVPTILPQEMDNLFQNKEINPTFHIGFCVKNLEIDLKVLTSSVKRKSKRDFRNFFKSSFSACSSHLTIKNGEWFNVQLGVSRVSVEIPVDEVKSNVKCIPFFSSGSEETRNFIQDTLFDEKFDFFALKMHQNLSYNTSDLTSDGISEAFEYSNFDFMYAIDFSVDTHLNLFTENSLLQKTPAFSIDYVHAHIKPKINHFNPSEEIINENAENSNFVSTSDIHPESVMQIQKPKDDIALLRFVFGSAVLKINSEVINRMIYLCRITPYLQDVPSYSSATGNHEKFRESKGLRKHTTQLTIFDFIVELHSFSPANYSPNLLKRECQPIFNEENYSSEHCVPVLVFRCKCIDSFKKLESTASAASIEDWRQIISLKAVDVSCTLLHTDQTYDLLKCNTFNTKIAKDLNGDYKELILEMKNSVFTSSKPNLLLLYYVMKYFMYCIWQLENKQMYYTNIFYTSLIDDASITDNPVLEIDIGKITLISKLEIEAFVLKSVVQGCHACVSKIQTYIPKKIVIFTTDESDNESSCIQVTLQNCRNCEENCKYPRCIWFNFSNLKFNADLVLYHWIFYEPTINVRSKYHSKTMKSVKEQSVSSRKISDASSGSYNRKYIVTYPKPKESVHSSSETEMHSPLDVTNTETSDLFFTAENISVATRPKDTIQKLVSNVEYWSDVIIFGEISFITLYVPAGGTLYRNVSMSIDEDQHQNDKEESSPEVLKFHVKHFKLKCDLPSNISEEFNSHKVMSFPKDVWFKGKLTSPFTVSMHELSVTTMVKDNLPKHVLKPLNMACTIGVSLRPGNQNESIVALCIHFDFQPIGVCINENQVQLISNLLSAFKFVSKVSKDATPSESNFVERHVSMTTEISDIDAEIQNRFTGWVQWTFSKCSLTFYSEIENESLKLSMNAEDSMMSLEFNEIFHKFKIKVASFGIYHYKRYVNSKLWQNGPFYGTIVQKCFNQPIISNKMCEEDLDERFLSATITRARSSNLKTRFSLSTEVSNLATTTNHDHFITEVIIKLCPVDVIIPLAVADKFLSILKSLISLYRSASHSNRDENSDCESALPFTCLPLVYFDMPVLRIFVPTLVMNSENYYAGDTLVCEMGPVHVDCHPKNPIMRKHLNPDVYYIISGQKQTSLEQKLQNQQYQVDILDISFYTGLWNEIERMLIKEQIRIEEPPSVLEQNPAVMWNQGCHPDTKNKIALRYRSPLISKFTCLFLIAPAIECFSLKTAVYGDYFEADVLTSMNITISLHQIPFLFTLYKEYENYVYPHFQKVETESANLVSSNTGFSQLRSMDSGIESLEQSSVGSSGFSKVKNYAQTSFKHRTTLKTGSFHLFPKLSTSAPLPTSTFKNETFKEIYVTAQNINLILYNTSEITEHLEKRLQFKDLFLFKIVQPYVLISNENNYSVQMGIFTLSGHVPNSNSSYCDTPCPTLSENRAICKKFLDLKTVKYASYTKIKNDSFMLKVNVGLNKKWKIDCNIGQPILIDCETDTVRIVKASVDVIRETCENSLQLFRKVPVNQTNNGEKFISRMKRLFNLVSNVVISSSHVFVILDPTTDDKSLLLNVSQLKVNVKSSSITKSSSESIVIQSGLKSVLVSFPIIRSDRRANVLFCDDLCNAGLGKENIVNNLLLNPCNVTVECWLTWQKWNLFKDSPWKYVKISSDNVVFNFNPAYLDALLTISKNYKQLVEDLLPCHGNSDNCVQENNEDNEEYYKDDLRAGAFQFIQRDGDEMDQLSPYEIVSCNRQIQPYICWKYPQPRALTKLQIYPVPVEDFDDQSSEYIAHCQLQYYCEMEKCFYTYVSFGLSQNTIQNVTLPVDKPQIVTCECWRIVLFNIDSRTQNLDSKINVKLLAGCIRVDTVFRPSLITPMQMLIIIDEVQFNFSAISQKSLIEHDTFADVPKMQLFASVTANNIKAFFSDYGYEKTVQLEVVCRMNLLNYEYLLLQSFIDPFFSKIIFHATEGSPCKLASIVKNIHFRISPNFIHTITVAQYLWNNWAKNIELPKKITVPYVISNNTNHTIEFYQEKTPYELRLYLPSFCRRLYAWYNPLFPKIVSVALLSPRKKFTSEPLDIKTVGCRLVTCVNDDQETCFLFISVEKPSSVIHEININGSFQVYNLTHSAMDLCVISYGKDIGKSKLCSAQIIAQTSVSDGQLLSVVLPVNQKLSFKVRYSGFEDDEHGQWSGLIPLTVSQKQFNQTSWMVKIPLKNHKEHFQSVWCQLTWEIYEEFPKFLVVFRPLCSVKSFLPIKSFVRILNDLDSPISSNIIREKGLSTDLFIPDTVSLDKYKAEYSPVETFGSCLSRVKFEKQRVQEKSSNAVIIQSLIDKIKSEQENNNWPYLTADTRHFSWKTEYIHDIKPIINVCRQEESGHGTILEIYPWAILINTSNQPVLLNISEVIYTIAACEIIVPPNIDSSFKLGLVENGDYFWSGSLQLVDDVNSSISKITGRIPVNGFVTVSIDSGTFITFLNITSKKYGDMRILNVCSSYVINNNSNLSIDCSAWVVCRSGNNVSVSFDIPSKLTNKSINLPVAKNPTIGQAIMKWYKMGDGDVQVLPYLILCINENIACPIRIYDLSEKLQYPITFSSSKSYTKLDQLPCIFLTAQQIDGQVFLTIWEEKAPHVTIHNMSQLSLNVISSKSEKEIEGISYCPDWNWKFCVISESFVHFYIRKPIYERNEKQVEYLMFSIQNNKHVKQTKWSLGVPLKPCVNQFVPLPLSQHHIKLGIFRNGFTFVVWIQSATANELPAKMSRTKLSDSFLPLNDAVPEYHSKKEDNMPENICDIPDQLMRIYNSDIAKFAKLSIVIEALSLTLSYNDEFSEEKDMASFHATNVVLDLNSARKQNEIAEDLLCKISIEGYQIDNELYHLHTYDFPVVLLCKSNTVENSKSYVLSDLLSKSINADFTALRINISLKANNLLKSHMWDVEFFVNSPNVFLEDKYLSKLKIGIQSIFSAVINSSNFKSNQSTAHNHEMTKQKTAERTPSISYSNVDARVDCLLSAQAKSSCSKSVNLSDCDTDDKTSLSSIKVESNVKNEDGVDGADFLTLPDSISYKNCLQVSYSENQNCCIIPDTIIERSKTIAKPLQLRNLYISSFSMTVSLRTSTTFYIALDRSPLKFSEFKKEYLTTSPFELGNLLIVHYFMGAVYGTGWAISSLEFVGSPGVLARDLGTGIKDFVSMPLYGIASGPRGFVLGIAHGSASLMKHVMTGTLSSVTNFAGSWARTLNRFTLDADDLLLSEQIRRVPPSNIAEGVLQGLSEFGIGLLGGISGIAHHPLQYAVSNTGNRSLINSISLGIVGVLTRPLSGAAELVAKTGQGILSHVGWKRIPIHSSSLKMENFSSLQICTLKHLWANKYENVLFTVEAVDTQNINVSLWVILTSSHLHIREVMNGCGRSSFDLRTHEFAGSDNDPTLIVVKKSLFNYKNADDFSTVRIYRFINETNRSLNFDSPYCKENLSYMENSEPVYNFCVNPLVKSSLLNFITYLKCVCE